MTFHALIFLDFEPNLDHSCSDLQICIQGSPHFCIFIFHVCWHFDKGATSNIDNIHHDHDGLPHVPLLTVHLLMVLISANFIFHVRWNFDKGATSNFDNILHDHDGLPHVPLLSVHLLMVLISENSYSMCAGILKKMRQVILITFSIIIMNSPMYLYSLSTW